MKGAQTTLNAYWSYGSCPTTGCHLIGRTFFCSESLTKTHSSTILFINPIVKEEARVDFLYVLQHVYKHMHIRLFDKSFQGSVVILQVLIGAIDVFVPTNLLFQEVINL